MSEKAIPGKPTVNVPPGAEVIVKPISSLKQIASATATAITVTGIQAYKHQLFVGLISLLAVIGTGFVLFSRVPALLTAGYSILTSAVILSGIVFVGVSLYRLNEKSLEILKTVYAVIPWLLLTSLIVSVLALYAQYGDIIERDIIKIPLISNINSVLVTIILVAVGYHIYHQIHLFDIEVIPSSFDAAKGVVATTSSNDIAYFIIMSVGLGIGAALLSTMYAQIKYHTTDG